MEGGREGGREGGGEGGRKGGRGREGEEGGRMEGESKVCQAIRRKVTHLEPHEIRLEQVLRLF